MHGIARYSTLIAQFITFCSASNLAEARCFASPVQGSSPAKTWTSHEAAGAPLWVSRQVLREYLVSLTRPQQFPIPPSLETVVAQVRQMQRRFRVADEGPAVTTRLLALVTEIPTYGRRIHDANIVATMLVYGIPRLRTNNPDDFVRFATLIE